MSHALWEESFSGSAVSINEGQLAQSVQADQGRNLLQSATFLHLEQSLLWYGGLLAKMDVINQCEMKSFCQSAAQMKLTYSNERKNLNIFAIKYALADMSKQNWIV